MKRIDILLGIATFAFLAVWISLLCSIYWPYGVMLLVGIILLAIVTVIQALIESHKLTKRAKRS